MHSIPTELGDQAFGKDADALVMVNYESHRHALKFVQSVLRSPKSVGILHGPRSSGKTTIARRVRDAIPDTTAVALIDGTDVRPSGLLLDILSQYGYHTELQTTDELLQMVKVFAMQQVRSAHPPILIVDNVEHMYPSALRVLNALAMMTSQHRYAIRILLTGHKGLSSLIAAEEMQGIERRHVGIFTIGPLSVSETMHYLHARLTTCGVQRPDTIFPVDSCERLRELSGGWPGLINHYAQEALCPKKPRLITTRNGETMSHYTFSTKKVLIGRSQFADIVLDDEFVSKIHAALLLYSNALVMLDLNSSNGTTVNSVRLQSAVLRDNDIIMIGDYRLKVQNAPAMSVEMEQRIQSPDTVRMRSLAEMRRLKDLWQETAPEKKKRG